MSTGSSINPEMIRVAIVGAGFGGLILALFLQKTRPDIRIDVYEAAQELTELGAGIGFFPRVWEILRQLGLENDLLKIVGTAPGLAEQIPVVYCKADEPDALHSCTITSASRGFQRSQVQMLLVKHLRSPDDILHFSKRLTSYDEPSSLSEPIVLRFADGTKATCDLLIGSDGIKSAVRRTMYNAFAREASEEAGSVASSMMIEPVWSGIVVYRALAPTAGLDEATLNELNKTMILYGKNKCIVSYPIAQGRFINTASFVFTPGEEHSTYDGPWVASATTEEVIKQFKSWNPLVTNLLQHIEKPLLWAVHKVRHLPTFVKGRVALVGDAAHAMTTFQASGAGQAIEDGFILASLLAHPSATRDTLPEMLCTYDAIRRPFAQNVARGSDQNGQLVQLQRLGWENVSAEESAAGGFAPEKLAEIADALDQSLSWTMKGSAMSEREKALCLFEEMIKG